MSSIWFVVSNFSLIDGEGFHVTEESARERVAQLGDAGSCSVLEVPDTAYEIHRGGSVPDVVWVLLEDGGVDCEAGYRVTRASARELLDHRDDSAYENWECSPERAEGVRLTDYLRDCWSSYEIIRVTRHDMGGSEATSSPEAARALALIRHDTDLPEPLTSVRGGLTTYTWERDEDVVVEVRVEGSRWASTVVHEPNARPKVWDHSEEIIFSARGALGAAPQVDLRLYLEMIGMSHLYLDV